MSRFVLGQVGERAATQAEAARLHGVLVADQQNVAFSVPLVQLTCDTGDSVSQLLQGFVAEIEIPRGLQVALELARPLLGQVLPGHTGPIISESPFGEIRMDANWELEPGCDHGCCFEGSLEWRAPNGEDRTPNEVLGGRRSLFDSSSAQTKPRQARVDDMAGVFDFPMPNEMKHRCHGVPTILGGPASAVTLEKA